MNYQNNAQQYAQNGAYSTGYGFNPAYPFAGNGMVPNNSIQKPRMGNWLNQDKINLLKKGIEQFTLSVSDEDEKILPCSSSFSLSTFALTILPL